MAECDKKLATDEQVAGCVSRLKSILSGYTVNWYYDIEYLYYFVYITDPNVEYYTYYVIEYEDDIDI